MAPNGGGAQAEAGFTSLFNGKDLSGWQVVGSPDAFRVEDGAIVAGGTPASHAFLRFIICISSFTYREIVTQRKPRSSSGSAQRTVAELCVLLSHLLPP